jgi:uncharacterized membrane protein YfcA
MMQESILLFYALLFIIAFLYASVGHGGASGYLALMALFAVSPAVMKPTALLLNIFVASVSLFQFHRVGHFNWKLFWPFAVTSVPLAFLGGLMSIDGSVYKKILGVLLIFPILRFVFFSQAKITKVKSPDILVSLLIGAVIGLLSGMIGIGGGIILSPILLLFNWADQKKTAAVSAAFILINSLSGLAGQLYKGIVFNQDMVLYVLVALAGGFLGAYFGAFRFQQNVLKGTLACVLVLAVFKLLFIHA